MNEYNPNFVSHPGITLKEFLNAEKISIKELSKKMGIPQKIINGVINGEINIDRTIAIQLHKSLGIISDFWLNRQYRYNEYKKNLGE